MECPGTKVGFTVNLNTAQADSDYSAAAFVSAISEAAATWNRTPGADFTLEFAGTTQSTQTGYNHANEIVFMPMGTDNRGALAQVWYNSDFTIVEADIWINDSFDWAADGELADNELDLQSALLHEFGHWLILNHTDDSTSVMYPTLAPGATRRQLAPRDAEGISAIYPCLRAAALTDNGALSICCGRGVPLRPPAAGRGKPCPYPIERTEIVWTRHEGKSLATPLL